MLNDWQGFEPLHEKSVVGVFLVRIFMNLDWMRTRKTPNTGTFHVMNTSLFIVFYHSANHAHVRASLIFSAKNEKILSRQNLVIL